MISMQKSISQLRKKVLDGDDGHGSGPLDFLTRPARWLWVFFRTMDGHRAFLWAAGMSYTTMVAMVPALLLLFGAIDALGIVESNQEVIAEVVAESFLGGLPEIKEIILPALFDVNLKAIGIVGIIGLLFIVSRLFEQVSNAFQVIFRSTRKRKLLDSLLFFYVTVTVAPLGIILVAVNSVQTLRGLGIGVGMNLLNLLVQFLALTLAIKAFPTRKVKWGNAFLGAGVAVVLIWIASWGFSWYVQVFDSRNPVRIIYGSLGVLPMFLAYIYLIWLSVLAGAETAAVSMDYNNLVAAELSARLQKEGFAHVPQVDMAIAITALVCHAFEHELGPVTSEQLAETLGGESLEPDHVARMLQEVGLLIETSKGWVPARSLADVSQREVAEAWHVATGSSDIEHPVADDVWNQLLDALDRPLPSIAPAGAEGPDTH